MEILSYVVLAAVTVFLFFWYRESRPQSKISHFEGKAEDFLSGYRSQRVVMYDDDQLPEEVTLMQDFYVRLKEQSRHTPQEIAKHAEDWMSYVVNKSLADSKFYLHIDDDGSVSTEEERQIRVEEMNESNAIAEEIENRFARQLGAAAQKKLAELRERQEKKSKEFWGVDEGTGST